MSENSSILKSLSSDVLHKALVEIFKENVTVDKSRKVLERVVVKNEEKTRKSKVLKKLMNITKKPTSSVMYKIELMHFLKQRSKKLKPTNQNSQKRKEGQRY